jgi:hypothetical protein
LIASRLKMAIFVENTDRTRTIWPKLAKEGMSHDMDLGNKKDQGAFVSP